ncbi:MAG TPA: hypothetical protein VFO34_06740 [Candidatus Acidoferrales bacterium]|nr:hypothetical protein [Candidatus Acidoferrales bacterium]
MKTHKRKARVPLLLALIGGIAAIVATVIKEVAVAELKDSRDAMASAQSQFHTATGNEEADAHAAALQQQIEALQIQGGAKLVPLIAQDRAICNEQTATLEAHFQATSQYIEKIGVPELTKLRNTVRQHIDTTERQIGETLNMTHDHSVGEFATVKGATLFAMSGEIGVVLLEDAAETAANRVIENRDRDIRILTWVYYLLFLCGSSLAIFGLTKNFRSGEQPQMTCPPKISPAKT